MRRLAKPTRGRCRRCPFRTPSGRCLDPATKSGRCGDWVWYVRGNKQWRHLYVKPQDPRTPKQLHWRARFGAASKKYSHSLTDQQQDTCIAAGAKLRSRLRLRQSGPLTGQQYSIRREYAANAEGKAQNAEKAQKGLQTQGVSRSTSGTHRGISGAPPGHNRLDTGRASKHEGRGKNAECRSRKVRAASKVRQPQRVTRSKWEHHRSNPWAMRRQAARNPGTFPVSRRASVRASPNMCRPPATQGSRARPTSRRRFPWRGRALAQPRDGCLDFRNRAYSRARRVSVRRYGQPAPTGRD